MIQYEITQMPLFGNATLSGSTIVYEPDEGYTGSDSIVYRAIFDGVPQKERRICLTIIEG